LKHYAEHLEKISKENQQYKSIKKYALLGLQSVQEGTIYTAERRKELTIP